MFAGSGMSTEQRSSEGWIESRVECGQELSSYDLDSLRLNKDMPEVSKSADIHWCQGKGSVAERIDRLS